MSMLNMLIQLKILDKRIGTQFDIPSYATDGSAGLDLRAMIETDEIVLWPGETLLVPTGISIYIKDHSMAGLIIPRSGLGHRQGLVLGNGTGLIDSDYQGQLQVSCWNRNDVAINITLGQRIAQLVIIPIVKVEFNVVKEFEQTDRGESGFGSSGTR